MNRCFSIGGRVVLALVAAAFLVGPAAAQSAGPNDSRYPYWATAPESYRGTNMRLPVAAPSPNIISNAAHATPFHPGSVYWGSGLGGAFLPPFLTAKDTGSRLPRSNGAKADNRAHIWLRVPADAEVWVDGVKTRQTGESRYFYSPPLKPGRQFRYRLRIRWMKDGKPVEKTQRLLVSAGVTLHRDFTRGVNPGP